MNLVLDNVNYTPPSEENTRYEVTFIGDAVALDAADQLAKAFPMGVIDCSDVRDAESVLEAYRGYSGKDVVGNKVVLCVANQGILAKEDVEALVDAVGSDKSLWLVNVRNPNPWCKDNNAVLDAVAAEHDNVKVIDWYGASEGHDDYLKDDGLRLTDEGADAYAALVSAAVNS